MDLRSVASPSPTRYQRRRDEESAGGGGSGAAHDRGKSGSGSGEIYLSNDAFDIPAKNAPLERLRRWRQAALVLNASRRFRYTLDLKKEEEKEQIRRMIRTHAQVIRAAFFSRTLGIRRYLGCTLFLMLIGMQDCLTCCIKTKIARFLCSLTTVTIVLLGEHQYYLLMVLGLGWSNLLR